VSVPCKKTKKKENPDSKNLVQNPDPGGGGGGGVKVDDPILTFEQKNHLDIERYEAYCAKSSFLRKKFGSEIVQSKCSKKIRIQR
jgi:hypothetical protein